MSGNWKDAFEVQMDLWKWAKSADGKNQMFGTTDYETLLPGSQSMIRSLIMNEEHKLHTADPFFVAAEFSDLIDAAAYTFRPEPLLMTDFLSEQGFVYFERPLLVPTRDPGKEMEFIGFSWTPLMSRDDLPEVIELARNDEAVIHRALGMALTLYERLPEGYTARYDDGTPIPLPRIVPSHLCPWYFGMTFEGNEFDVENLPTAAEAWWKPTQVTLRLMQQKLAQRHGTHPERASRRRGERLGFRPREVVVVRLRRHKSAPTGDERNVNWTHRWIVHGGWQWRRHGAGRTLRRQVWIGDYVKGPDDKPLLPKGRAFQWEE